MSHNNSNHISKQGNDNEKATDYRSQQKQGGDGSDRVRNDTDEVRLSDVNPDEEVTPKNVQSPIDDKDKDRQNDVLHADHVRLGFPANGVPRTDEERQQMKDAGLLQ